MSDIGDGFKNIFLAGIGVMAYTGEKGKEIIDQLVEKGEITLEQGRELNEELKVKTEEAAASVRESTLEATMKMMTPEEREAFAAKAAEFATAQNAEETKTQDEVETEVEADAETATADAETAEAETAPDKA